MAGNYYRLSDALATASPDPGFQLTINAYAPKFDRVYRHVADDIITNHLEPDTDILQQLLNARPIGDIELAAQAGKEIAEPQPPPQLGSHPPAQPPRDPQDTPHVT